MVKYFKNIYIFAFLLIAVLVSLTACSSASQKTEDSSALQTEKVENKANREKKAEQEEKKKQEEEKLKKEAAEKAEKEKAEQERLAKEKADKEAAEKAAQEEAARKAEEEAQQAAAAEAQRQQEEAAAREAAEQNRTVYVARNGTANVYWYDINNMPKNTRFDRVVTMTEAEAKAAGKRPSQKE